MWNIFVLATLLPLVFCNDVILLTKDNYDELFNHPIALVKYFAPWCGHCKALAPHYEAAALDLKGTLPLFEVNCDEDKDLCSKADISGYPTLKLYTNGVYTEDYHGERSKQAIVDYMLEQSRPPASIVDSVQFKEALDSNDYVIVLQSDKSSEIDEFQNVARQLRKIAKFYYTKEKLIDSNSNSIVQLSRPKLFESKLEERVLTYKDPIEEAGLAKWIRANLIGLVGIRDDKKESLFGYPLLVLYTHVDFERDPSNIRYYRNRLLQVAKDSKSDLHFSLADYKMFSMEMDKIGLDISGKKAIVAIRASEDKHFVMEDEKINIDTLKKFISDYSSGKLEVFIKSEPVPLEQEDVVKVVGKTFNDIVFDKSKDVLIEFFAPWCGHCKALKPKYEELAKKLSREDEIVIAAIDATANSYPSEFEVTGYPTIYWVPKGNKKKIERYQGSREVEDMLKFVASSSTNELKGYSREGVAKQEEL